MGGPREGPRAGRRGHARARGREAGRLSLSRVPSRRLRWGAALVAGLFCAALVAWQPVRLHAKAASLLARFVNPAQPGALGRWDQRAVSVEEQTFPSAKGPARVRLFHPQGVASPPRLVLVHGVHHLGIDEPRLNHFARTLAEAGLEVFTPEVRELADYRVEPSSVETIGAAVHFAARSGAAVEKVGLMGLSFAGGLGLVAAADPRFAPEVGYVVSVGGHHDLARVARFFALDEIERPDGSKVPFAAHEYGPLVLAYGHLEALFSAEDLVAAGEAVRLWLWERPDEAWTRARALSPAGQAQLGALFHQHREALRPALLALIVQNAALMAAVSPSHHLETLRAPVLLLHGESDNVIPSSETLWLARAVPRSLLVEALVSAALQHVEMQGPPPLSQQWQLVHFMAQLLRLAAQTR